MLMVCEMTGNEEGEGTFKEEPREDTRVTNTAKMQQVGRVFRMTPFPDQEVAQDHVGG